MSNMLMQCWWFIFQLKNTAFKRAYVLFLVNKSGISMYMKCCAFAWLAVSKQTLIEICPLHEKHPLKENLNTIFAADFTSNKIYGDRL